MNDIHTRSADLAVRPRVAYVEQKEVAEVAAASKVTIDIAATSFRDAGKPQPVVKSEAKAPANVDDSKRVEQAVARLNDYVQSLQRDIRFSVDQDSGQSVVRVVERGSQEVIRQIPTEVALRLAHNLLGQSAHSGAPLHENAKPEFTLFRAKA